jgi:uncharacterized protein YjhX (UPF0386 family)
MYVNHPYERTDKIISSHLARGVRGNMFHVKVLATCEMYALRGTHIPCCTFNCLNKIKRKYMMAVLLMNSVVAKMYLLTKRHMIRKFMPSHQYAYQK